MPLILEPGRWNRQDLLELAKGQDEGLRQILGVFEAGRVPFPHAWAGDASIELMRAVIAWYGSESDEAPPARLTAVVNAQYATMLAVSRLVPSTLLADQAAKKRTSTAATSGGI
jgi:hypothetical protein